LEPNPEDLLKLLHGWRDEAIKAGRPITRIAVAYETGRDSFWLARWLRERGIDAHVIHATSVAVSREHRRAKTDRLDTAMLKRGFLGWLRGERGHCTVAIVPTMEEEDAKRPHREREGLVHEQTRVVNRMKSALIQFGVRNFNPKLRKARVKLETVRTPEGKSLPPNTIAALRRDMERLKIIKEQIKAIEQARLQQFEQKPEALANRMVYLLVRIYGLGWETADLLVHELLSRTLRDRKAVARYAGLTGSPDESGSKRREKGLSRSGNARVRKIMIQLAWRMVKFQPDSALVQWFKQRTENAKGSRKPMPASSSLPCGAMRMTASYRKASGCIQRRNRQQEGRRNFGTSARIATKRPKTIRGSGSPPSPHGFCTGKKNGLLLLRSLAFDAHSCIMVRIQRIHRI
jgi:transposase